MEKDKIKPDAQGSDSISLPQSMRLLRMIESLGLKPDTVDGLRRVILVEDTQVQDSRPGAQVKPVPQFAAEDLTGSIIVPITPVPEPRPTRGAVLADHTNPIQPLPTMEAAKAATTRLDLALEAELK